MVIRNRVILLLQGLFLISFLLVGASILSMFQDYSTEEFRERCEWQTKYAATLLTERLPDRPTREETEAQTKKVAKELNIDLAIFDAREEESNEVARAYVAGLGFATRINPQNQEKSLYVAVPVGRDSLVLRTMTTMAPVIAAYGKVRTAIIVAFCLAMLLVTWLAKYLARKMLQPLEEIAEAAEKMSQGDLSIRLQRNVAGEFSVLSHALNNLAESLVERQNEIASEKRKLELILKDTDNLVITLNQNGYILDCNDQFKALFGQTVLGQHHLQIINNVALGELLATCLKTDSAVSKNITVGSAQGKHSFQVFAAPLKVAYSNIPNSALLVFHDITALQAVYDKQADFVSNASHELATPLTTIKGFAEILLGEEAPEEVGLRRKFLGIILKESERMQALIHDLLQMAKLNSEEYRKSINLESFVPSDILEKVREELAARAQAKNLKIEVVYECEPAAIIANRDWLKQILVNLLENALKYTPDSGTISLRYDSDEQFAVFTVHNSGEAIAPQDAARIFDRFYRTDKARTRQAGGTGLGLSIVKFIVEMFGGNISVISKPGEGVSFVFTIPRDMNAANKKA